MEWCLRSGTLATGPQTIRLTGSGTPTDDGDFDITVSFGSSTCDLWLRLKLVPLLLIGNLRKPHLP